LESEIRGGANDTNGDLTSVRDQDLGQHGCQSWSMTTPGATWHVSAVEETGSTDTDLLVTDGTGAPDRTVLRARHQTAGKGRLDRQWNAPPDANLLGSLLFRAVRVTQPQHP